MLQTGDILKTKIQKRPDRQSLVQQHILEGTSTFSSVVREEMRLFDGKNNDQRDEYRLLCHWLGVFFCGVIVAQRAEQLLNELCRLEYVAGSDNVMLCSRYENSTLTS